MILVKNAQIHTYDTFKSFTSKVKATTHYEGHCVCSGWLVIILTEL